MLQGPIYREAVKHRQAAVEDSRLVRTVPLPIGEIHPDRLELWTARGFGSRRRPRHRRPKGGLSGRRPSRKRCLDAFVLLSIAVYGQRREARRNAEDA